MKTHSILLTMILLTVFSLSSKAQNWNEIFRQKKTQKKYLLRQITGLQIYLDFAAKGYGITRTGLWAVSGLKNAELNLHDAFFNTLIKINPKLKTLPQVSAIISTELTIFSGCKRSVHAAVKQGLLNLPEIIYLEKVYEKLQEDCAEILEETFGLLTENHLQMNDAERLRALSLLSTRMQDNLAFYHNFSTQTAMLSSARRKEVREVLSGKKYYGLNPD